MTRATRKDGLTSVLPYAACDDVRQPWHLHPAWWQPSPLGWWSAHSSLQYIRPSRFTPWVDAYDANAVAAGAFHSINGHSHGIAPVSVMSSSCSCGSARCSIMLVSMSRTWESG